jgi:hypothetical protein
MQLITERVHHSQYVGFILHKMRSDDFTYHLFGDSPFPKKQFTKSKQKAQVAWRLMYRRILDSERPVLRVKQRKGRAKANGAIDHENSFTRSGLGAIFNKRVDEPSITRSRTRQ